MVAEFAAGSTLARPFAIKPEKYTDDPARPRLDASRFMVAPPFVAPTVAPPVVIRKTEPASGVLPPIPFGGEWEIQPHYLGETIFVVASGPSLLKVNYELLRGRKIICVNSSVEHFPFASFLYFGDGRWWAENKKKFGNFAGHVLSCSGLVTSKRVLKVSRLKPINPATGFSESRKGLASQRTSLQGGMNLAAHLCSDGKTAGKIVLVAADMGRDPETGISHGHKPHKWTNRPGNVTWDEQMRHLKWIAAPLQRKGIPVINTSMVSRIPWWPKMTLEKFLEEEKAGRQ